MRTYKSSIFPLFVLVLLSMASMGCRMFSYTFSQSIYAGETSKGNRISLYKNGSQSLFRTQYCELFLVHSGKDGDPAVYKIARVEGSKAGPLTAFNYRKLEARCCPDEKQFWIIDLDKKQIIASVDLNTELMTGPDDDAPAWAWFKAGKVLRSTLPGYSEQSP